MWILLGRWEGNFTRWDWRGGRECGFYEQMCRPAGSGLNPWKYGGRGQQDIFSHVKIQTVSKRVGQEKLKKPKASEIDLFCQNQLVFVSTTSLKHGVFCIPEKDLLCRQTDIRHRLRAL